MRGGAKGTRLAQIAYLVGTAVTGLVLVFGGLVAGDYRLSLLGVLIVALSALGTRWSP